MDCTIEEAVEMLGSMGNDSSYKLRNGCSTMLAMIDKELTGSPTSSKLTRIRLGKCKLVENHLLHILTSEQVEDQNILSVSLRILVKLTLPLECFLTFGECESCCNSCFRFDCLHHLLLQYKKAFLINSSATAALIRLIRNNFKHCENSERSAYELSLVNDALMLLRNLLHVPDSADFHRFQPFTSSPDSGHLFADHCSSSRDDWQECYRKIAWNLLVQGLDSTLLSLLNHRRNSLLSPTIVQIISLLFKELNVAQMQVALQSGRANMDISDDDDAQSDSSSSVQRSSSSSCLSSDASPASSLSPSPSQAGEKGHGKGDPHSSRTTCSDSGFSGTSAREISDKSESHASDSVIHLNAENVQQAETGSHAVDVRSGEFPEREANSELEKSSSQDSCSHNLQIYNSVSSADEMISSSNSSNSANNGDNVVRSDANTESKRGNSRGEQTSGISHGSSEEDQTRVTRKVIKAHHRSAMHRDQSDSSDEYNEKPPIVTDHTQVKKPHPNVRPQPYIPAIVRSKCCPSVCMEAAFESSTKVIVIPSSAVTVPWEKRRTYGSRNFPLDLNSFVPTNDDLAALLKDFVFMLLHNFFSQLIIDMKHDMVLHIIDMDDSHFLWMIGYFTKLAVSIDLEFHHFDPLLTSELFSFLVYKGVLLNEEIELSVTRKSTTDMRTDDRKKFILKKMHLTVSAIRELLQAVLTYMPKLDGRQDRESLQVLRNELSEMSDLRQLFLLFIRNFLPTVHTKQFLVEVIVTHHLAMLLLEPVHVDGRFNLHLHLRQFATTQVMDHCGKVLQDFKSNTDFVNDCVLTLMHHVAGDLMSPECLFQPIILKTFSLIMESDTDIKDCWGDLIEYIMILFVRSAKKSRSTYLRTMFGMEVPIRCFDLSGSSVTTSSESDRDSLLLLRTIEFRQNGMQAMRTRSDRDRLYWLYLQFEQAADPIGLIADALSDEFNVQIERKEIVAQLIAKGIIHDSELHRFEHMFRSEMFQRKSVIHAAEQAEVREEIGVLVRELCKTNMRQQVIWVHDFLLAVAAVRSRGESASSAHAIPFNCMALSESVPLVPFNENQEMALNSGNFLNFLQELGLTMPQNAETLYPRVPVALDSGSISDYCIKIASYSDYETHSLC